MTLYREAAVLGNEILQIGLVDTLEQLFKGGGPEIRQHNQHPLAGAQPDVGLGHGGGVSGKQHPAVFHPDIVQAHSAKFLAGNALQAEQAGHGKFKLVHSSSVFSLRE